jgi:hypothetical protein
MEPGDLLMKSVSGALVLGVLLWGVVLGLGQGGPDSARPLVDGEGKKEGKPQKPLREMKMKEGREWRSMRPQPFLMAGDPRFQKMLLLALTPKEEIQKKLKDWPGLANMTEERRAQMQGEMEAFRARIFRTALKDAEESGLSLSEEQELAYVKRYWEGRSRVEGEIRASVQDRLQAAMQKEREALQKEFAPGALPKP